MEECLRYFRDILYRPEQVPGWDEWWAANESLVRTVFPAIDYQRLKVRKLFAVRDLLSRLGASDDPLPPIHLDLDFIHIVNGVRWFERCGEECRVAVPFPTARAADWSEAQAACEDSCWSEIQLEATNALTLFLHDNHRARYQRWNEIAAAAKAASEIPLTENVWRPFCQQRGLSEKIAHSVQWNVLHAIMAHEYGDCLGRPAFALHLFVLYRAGHFPCGWRGEWPRGQLLVL